jgi:hypothetical protein
MTPDAALRRIESSFDSAGFNKIEAAIGGRSVIVARTSHFFWWGFARLHTFVFLTLFDGDTSAGELDQFLREGVEYAKSNKGGLPRGLQTGVAAITVAVTTQLPSAAADWAIRAALDGRRCRIR